MTAPFQIQHPIKRHLALCGIMIDKYDYFPHRNVTPAILEDTRVCVECRAGYSKEQ